MTRCTRRLALLGLVGWAGLVVSCAGPTPPADRVISARCRVIDSLRTRGRYDAALERAQELERVTARAGTRPWQAQDARRLTRTLARIVALPPAAQREMACADSLTPVILALLDEGDDFITATDDAARQLELRSRTLGPDHPEVAASLDLLGQVSRSAREYGSAREYLERALALRRAVLGPRHPKVGETLEHQAVLYKELHRHAAAEASYRGAISILEAAVSGDDPMLADALQALGSFCRMGHRFDEAEALYARALQMTRRYAGARSAAAAERLLWSGFSQLYAGRLEAAERSLLESRTIFLERKMERTHAMGNVAFFLAKVRWLRGDNPGALRWWREYFQCRTNTRAGHAQGYGLANLLGLAGDWVDVLLCEGRSDEAWGEFSGASAPAAQSLLDLAAARRLEPASSAQLDSLRGEVLHLRGRLAAWRSSHVAPGGTDGAVGGQAAQTMADSLRVRLARVDAARMQLERSIMTRGAPTLEDSLTVQRVQSHLRPDQAMIGWILATWTNEGDAQRRTIWACVLRNTGPPRWIRVGTWCQAEAAFKAWSTSIALYDRILVRSSQWPHRVAEDRTLAPLARDAWDKLASPLMPYLEGASELIVVQSQSRPLWPTNIYPECFVDPQGILMGQRFAFSYTPSPRIFVQLAEAALSRDAGRRGQVVALADPLGSGEAPLMASLDTDWNTLLRDAAAGYGPTIVDPALSRSALAGDEQAIRHLPPLPNSRTEVLKLASAFPTTRVLLGPDAEVAALDSILVKRTPFKILHLATHTLIDDDDPSRSALVLSLDRAVRPDDAGRPVERDLITADEVLMTWKLDADLVTLSGCQTGRGTWTRGGEDMGFEQAFLAAGARCLLMSRWKVDDRATALLMGRFYENLAGSRTRRDDGRPAAPMPAARALQEAQVWLRELRDGDGRTPFANPVYWAGFVLVGDADRVLAVPGMAAR